jgi:hypothetical protein
MMWMEKKEQLVRFGGNWRGWGQMIQNKSWDLGKINTTQVAARASLAEGVTNERFNFLS